MGWVSEIMEGYRKMEEREGEYQQRKKELYKENKNVQESC